MSETDAELAHSRETLDNHQRLLDQIRMTDPLRERLIRAARERLERKFLHA